MSRKKRTGSSISAPFGIVNYSKGTPSILRDEDDMVKKYFECEGQKNCLHFGLHFVHRPKIWKKIYDTNQSPNLRRWMRVLVQIQTIQAILRGKYFVESGNQEDDSEQAVSAAAATAGASSSIVSKDGRTKLEPKSQTPETDGTAGLLLSVSLDKKKMIQASTETKKYESDHQYKFFGTQNPNYGTHYLIINEDCLDVALYLSKKFPHDLEPIVLDMASSSLPGGGWKSGSAAQEENLHRRTNLMHCLEDPYQVNPTRKWSYPLPQFGGLYVPKLTVFRGSEKDGYPFLKESHFLSFVAVAAFKMPPTEIDGKTGEEVLGKKVAHETVRKMEAILNIALENGHTVLVLSAFGCGAYLNPPGHVARLFRDLLKSEKYCGRFKIVAFAIIDPVTKVSTRGGSRPIETIGGKIRDSSSGGKKTGDRNFEKAAIFAETFQVELLTLDKHRLELESVGACTTK